MTTLEKIKAEIQKVLDKERDFSTESAKAQAMALMWCLEIIDKYASEECDNDCEHCAYLECPKEPCEDAIEQYVKEHNMVLVSKEMADFYKELAEREQADNLMGIIRGDWQVTFGE